MDAIANSSNREPGNVGRFVRGIVGAGAVLAIFLVPGLSSTWIFILAVIGCYGSLAALIGTDLFAVRNLGNRRRGVAPAVAVQQATTAPSAGRARRQVYKKVA